MEHGPGACGRPAEGSIIEKRSVYEVQIAVRYSIQVRAPATRQIVENRDLVPEIEKLGG
jgi:hypothetical protein